MLVLGVADGAVEQEFDRVTDALHLPDGRVVVANDGSAELRYFAGDGRFLASAGRRGQGPGEFQSIARLWRAGGDTVVAYDPLLSRLTTFAGPGRLVGVSSLRPVTGGGPVPPELLGRFRDGTFLARALAPLPLDAPPGARRVPVAYFRVRPGDSTATLLGHFPGDESFVVREGSGVSANQPMFGRRTYVAVAGDRFYVGNSDTYQIAVHTADGGLLRSIRAAQPNAPVTRAHVERYRQGYLAQVEPESRPRLETILAQMPVPSTFPAHGRMLVDTDANLWVAEYPRPGAGWQVWNVFDARGRWLGPVEMPAQFRITAVGSGKVLGVLHGEREVEQVRAYRLMR
ncbi:MAG TPA: hypothetical protein VJT67_04090 [Longimicrobiaceae bacterium]|nr:hypothetical protein [Longimicrobiaceae bacterium]